MSSEHTNDRDVLREHIGRTQTQVETVSTEWCNRLELALDREAVLNAGDPLPPLWHFIIHPPLIKTSALDVDGHAKRGVFLPPVALPRRMWAGSRFEFYADILLGDEVTKQSTIGAVDAKQGRSGQLCFVTVKHELSVTGDVRLVEEQDLVFREAPAPGASTPAPKPAPVERDFSRLVTPSEILLFRYSALTFNSHRIHYDRDYARGVEGYPGLVFHGPLAATLLADLAVRETGERLGSFSFRAMAPLFDTDPFTIAGVREGSEVRLWAQTPDGGVAMSATGVLRS